MSEHIERDRAYAILKDASLQENTKEDKAKIAFAMVFLSQQPAADVEPVVRGRWKWISKGTWECTNCGSRRYTNKNKRCPNCGAHMERSGSGDFIRHN